MQRQLDQLAAELQRERAERKEEAARTQRDAAMRREAAQARAVLQLEIKAALREQAQAAALREQAIAMKAEMQLEKQSNAARIALLEVKSEQALKQAQMEMQLKLMEQQIRDLSRAQQLQPRQTAIMVEQRDASPIQDGEVQPERVVQVSQSNSIGPARHQSGSVQLAAQALPTGSDRQRPERQAKAAAPRAAAAGEANAQKAPVKPRALTRRSPVAAKRAVVSSPQSSHAPAKRAAVPVPEGFSSHFFISRESVVECVRTPTAH